MILQHGLEIRPVPNEPGVFARVDGTVWSQWTKRHRTDQRRNWTRGLSLRQVSVKCADERHYPTVALRTTRRRLHLVILETFVGPCPEGMEACHTPDPSRHNCAIDNLKYQPHAKNIQDIFEYDVRYVDYNRGEDHHNAVITRELIDEVRAQYATGDFNQQELAELHGVSQTVISRIVRGMTYLD